MEVRYLFSNGVALYGFPYQEIEIYIYRGRKVSGKYDKIMNEYDFFISMDFGFIRQCLLIIKGIVSSLQFQDGSSALRLTLQIENDDIFEND